MTLAIGTFLLAAFWSGEILAIDILTFVPLVFILSLPCPCLCIDEIKSEYAHNMHTGGGGRESMYSDYIILIALPIHLLFT